MVGMTWIEDASPLSSEVIDGRSPAFHAMSRTPHRSSWDSMDAYAVLTELNVARRTGIDPWSVDPSEFPGDHGMRSSRAHEARKSLLGTNVRLFALTVSLRVWPERSHSASVNTFQVDPGEKPRDEPWSWSAE
ncbi:hypothetical protein D3C74_399560 [compost metagenome]